MKSLIEREGIEVEALIEAPEAERHAGSDRHRIYYCPERDLYVHCERRTSQGDWWFIVFDSDGAEALATRSLRKVTTLLLTGHAPVEATPEPVPAFHVPVRS
jgi:hypothetical protein